MRPTPLKLAIPVLALSLLLIGCGDNFADVQAEDTIEAYETFLANNPGSRFEMEANDRLETLYIKAAREAGTLAAYDAYLERFPEGNQREGALDEREGVMFSEAGVANTKEAWEGFLEAYPKAKKERKKHAEAMIKVAKYIDQLELGPATMEQVNLAEDPEGPLNGWRFAQTVKNVGDKTFESVYITIEFLDENGKKVGGKSWAACAPYYPVPIEDEHYKPLKPGDEIEWYWTDGNMPEGWGRQIRTYVSKVKIAKKE